MTPTTMLQSSEEYDLSLDLTIDTGLVMGTSMMDDATQIIEDALANEFDDDTSFNISPHKSIENSNSDLLSHQKLIDDLLLHGIHRTSTNSKKIYSSNGTVTTLGESIFTIPEEALHGQGLQKNFNAKQFIKSTSEFDFLYRLMPKKAAISMAQMHDEVSCNTESLIDEGSLVGRNVRSLMLDPDLQSIPETSEQYEPQSFPEYVDNISKSESGSHLDMKARISELELKYEKATKLLKMSDLSVIPFDEMTSVGSIVQLAEQFKKQQKYSFNGQSDNFSRKSNNKSSNRKQYKMGARDHKSSSSYKSTQSYKSTHSHKSARSHKSAKQYIHVDTADDISVLSNNNYLYDRRKPKKSRDKELYISPKHSIIDDPDDIMSNNDRDVMKSSVSGRSAFDKTRAMALIEMSADTDNQSLISMDTYLSESITIDMESRASNSNYAHNQQSDAYRTKDVKSSFKESKIITAGTTFKVSPCEFENEMLSATSTLSKNSRYSSTPLRKTNIIPSDTKSTVEKKAHQSAESKVITKSHITKNLEVCHSRKGPGHLNPNSSDENRASVSKERHEKKSELYETKVVQDSTIEATDSVMDPITTKNNCKGSIIPLGDVTNISKDSHNLSTVKCHFTKSRPSSDLRPIAHTTNECQSLNASSQSSQVDMVASDSIRCRRKLSTQSIKDKVDILNKENITVELKKEYMDEKHLDEKASMHLLSNCNVSSQENSLTLSGLCASFPNLKTQSNTKEVIENEVPYIVDIAFDNPNDCLGYEFQDCSVPFDESIPFDEIDVSYVGNISDDVVAIDLVDIEDHKENSAKGKEAPVNNRTTNPEPLLSEVIPARNNTVTHDCNYNANDELIFRDDMSDQADRATEACSNLKADRNFVNKLKSRISKSDKKMVVDSEALEVTKNEDFVVNIYKSITAEVPMVETHHKGNSDTTFLAVSETLKAELGAEADFEDEEDVDKRKIISVNDRNDSSISDCIPTTSHNITYGKENMILRDKSPDLADRATEAKADKNLISNLISNIIEVEKMIPAGSDALEANENEDFEVSNTADPEEKDERVEVIAKSSENNRNIITAPLLDEVIPSCKPVATEDIAHSATEDLVARDYTSDLAGAREEIILPCSKALEIDQYIDFEIKIEADLKYKKNHEEDSTSSKQTLVINGNANEDISGCDPTASQIISHGKKEMVVRDDLSDLGDRSTETCSNLKADMNLINNPMGKISKSDEMNSGGCEASEGEKKVDLEVNVKDSLVVVSTVQINDNVVTSLQELHKDLSFLEEIVKSSTFDTIELENSDITGEKEQLHKKGSNAHQAPSRQLEASVLDTWLDREHIPNVKPSSFLDISQETGFIPLQHVCEVDANITVASSSDSLIGCGDDSVSEILTKDTKNSLLINSQKLEHQQHIETTNISTEPTPQDSDSNKTEHFELFVVNMYESLLKAFENTNIEQDRDSFVSSQKSAHCNDVHTSKIPVVISDNRIQDHDESHHIFADNEEPVQDVIDVPSRLLNRDADYESKEVPAGTYLATSSEISLEERNQTADDEPILYNIYSSFLSDTSRLPFDETYNLLKEVNSSGDTSHVSSLKDKKNLCSSDESAASLVETSMDESDRGASDADSLDEFLLASHIDSTPVKTNMKSDRIKLRAKDTYIDKPSNVSMGCVDFKSIKLSKRHVVLPLNTLIVAHSSDVQCNDSSEAGIDSVETVLIANTTLELNEEQFNNNLYDSVEIEGLLTLLESQLVVVYRKRSDKKCWKYTLNEILTGIEDGVNIERIDFPSEIKECGDLFGSFSTLSGVEKDHLYELDYDKKKWNDFTKHIQSWCNSNLGTEFMYNFDFNNVAWLTFHSKNGAMEVLKRIVLVDEDLNQLTMPYYEHSSKKIVQNLTKATRTDVMENSCCNGSVYSVRSSGSSSIGNMSTMTEATIDIKSIDAIQFVDSFVYKDCSVSSTTNIETGVSCGWFL